MNSIFILSFILACSAFPRHKREIGTIYDIVHIEITNPDIIYKRSEEYSLPENLHAKFVSKGEISLIRLKKADVIDAPVYIAHNGQIIKRKVQNHDSSAVYHDMKSGTPILVKVTGAGESGGQIYTLEGTLALNSKILGVSVDEIGQHVLRDMEDFNYGDDEIFLKGKKKEDRKSIKEMKQELEKRKKTTSKSQVNTFTVELLIVADYSVKERFYKKFRPKQAEEALKIYFGFIAYSIHQRLSSITEIFDDIIIEVELSGIVIMNSTNDAPFCQENMKRGLLQYDPALDDFAIWSDTADLPEHDHAMWITDETLASGRNTDTNGASFVGTACTEDRVSVVEDYYTGRTAQIAAHELGHNLNAVHDSRHRHEDCDNGAGYIMSSFSYFPKSDSLKSRPFKFSECSADEIAYFLFDDPDSECLTEDNNGFTKHIKTYRAGQSVNADQQCRMALDNVFSFYCRYEQSIDSVDNMCVNLHCYDPEEDECVTGYIAFDYTSCGNKKWCIKGKCVKDPSAPQTSGNCPQGERIAAKCDVKECTSYNFIEKADCCEKCWYEPPAHVCDTVQNPYKCYWCHEKIYRLKRKNCRKYRD